MRCDLLMHFEEHWEKREGDPEAQRELVTLIVDRAYVDEDQVVVMTLHSNYHLVMGHKTNGPTEFKVDPALYASGSDRSWAIARISRLLFLPAQAVRRILPSDESSSS